MEKEARQCSATTATLETEARCVVSTLARLQTERDARGRSTMMSSVESEVEGQTSRP